MIARPCNTCQEDYLADPRYLNRGQGLFCSRACAGKYNGQRRTITHDPNTVCGFCSTKIWIKPSQLKKSTIHFCNRSCQHDGFRAGIVVPGPKYQGGQTKPACDICGLNRTRPGVCKKCSDRITLTKWLDGDNSVTLDAGGATKTFVKTYIRSIRGDKCEVCGWDELSPDGRSIIQMDHVDGNCMNNSPDNLKLLCPNHHAMTPTYGSLNKGSGRSWRRKNK